MASDRGPSPSRATVWRSNPWDGSNMKSGIWSVRVRDGKYLMNRTTASWSPRFIVSRKRADSKPASNHSQVFPYMEGAPPPTAGAEGGAPHPVETTRLYPDGSSFRSNQGRRARPLIIMNSGAAIMRVIARKKFPVVFPSFHRCMSPKSGIKRHNVQCAPARSFCDPSCPCTCR